MSNLTEDQIRADERRRVAEQVEENAQTFADAAADKVAAVRLVALAVKWA